MFVKFRVLLTSLFVATGLLAMPLVVVPLVSAPAYAASYVKVSATFTPAPAPIAATTIASKRIKSSYAWFIVRASGLVAAVSLVLMLLSGIGMVTGHTYKLFEPLKAWANHRTLGLAFSISVLVHMSFMLFNKNTPFTIAQLLFPFVSKYHPVYIGQTSIGSLWVALGIIAMYCLLAIVLTSLLWIDKKPSGWKLTHFLSYVVMLFVFFHALYLGTDLARGIYKYIWVVSALVVTSFSLVRLTRARTMVA
jgi:sulfoxide reductase heme-binding subunit YedZ